MDLLVEEPTHISQLTSGDSPRNLGPATQGSFLSKSQLFRRCGGLLERGARLLTMMEIVDLERCSADVCSLVSWLNEKAAKKKLLRRRFGGVVSTTFGGRESQRWGRGGE